MIVVKAPAGFDPTWPAIPVDPTCPHCKGWGNQDQCGPCAGEGSLDLAALLCPKDCPWCEGRARRATPSESVERQGLTIAPCEHCPDGKLRQRVALAIETPCETCEGVGELPLADIDFDPLDFDTAPCSDCVAGVRLRVEYTAQVDAVMEIPEPDLAECDWGFCNGEAVASRWASEFNDFLPVCAEHGTDWSPGRVAVLISDVHPWPAIHEHRDLRPFDGPVAELSEVLA